MTIWVRTCATISYTTRYALLRERTKTGYLGTLTTYLYSTGRYYTDPALIPSSQVLTPI